MNNLKYLLAIFIILLFTNVSFGQLVSVQLENDRLNFLEDGTMQGSLSLNGLHLSLSNKKANGFLVLEAENFTQLTSGRFIELLAENSIIFYTGSPLLESMRINGLGNVGIGTSTPDQKLDVNGNIALTNGIARIEFKESTDVKSYIEWNGTDLILQNDESVGADIILDATDDLIFQTGTSGLTRMIIDEDGDVGIGTTVPLADLHISGNARVQSSNPRVQFTNASGAFFGQLLGINNDIVLENTIPNVGRLIFDADKGFDFRRDSDGELLMRYEESTKRLYVGNNPPLSLSGAVRLFVSGGAFFGHQISALFPPSGGSTIVTDPDGKLFYESSSNRYNTNIKSFKTDFSKILELQLKTYTLKDNPSIKQIGVISEEVEKLGLTDLIVYNAKGQADAVQYRKMALYLIPVVKEQQNVIEEQAAQIVELEMRLAKIERLINNLSTEEDRIKLPENSMPQNFQLQQNQPNPFNESTSISYVVPKHIQQAYIQIQDMSGQVLKKINISETGAGQIDLATAELATGQYAYSLVLDGKIVATKQMILSK